NESRSTMTTWANRSARTRAAKSPAMLPPITMARSGAAIAEARMTGPSSTRGVYNGLFSGARPEWTDEDGTMSSELRRRLPLEPIADDPEVGRWLAALEDGRRDTLRELARGTPHVIDWDQAAALHTIGALRC